MKPVFRWGNMPKPLAEFHRKFKSQFLGADEETESDFALVWECSNPLEVLDWIKLHPLINEDDSQKTIQPIIDKKTGRMYIVAIGLGDRVSIGDIDPTTGEITPGIREEHPVIIYSEVSESWLKAILKARSKDTELINQDLAKEYAEQRKIKKET